MRGAGDRCCSRCGNSYFRRNLLEVWTLRNGWRKEIAKICTRCMNSAEARKVFNIFGISYSKLKVAA